MKEHVFEAAFVAVSFLLFYVVYFITAIVSE